MGYLRSVLSIMKQLSKTYPKVTVPGYNGVATKDIRNPQINELFSLLDGVTKIPKEEFGRYNKLQFPMLQEDTAGIYRTGSRNIGIDPKQSKDYLTTFLHELEHGKQFNPDAHEMETMKGLIATSNTKDYYDQPIEKLARLVSFNSGAKPRNFSDVHDYELNRDWVNRSANEGSNLIHNAERGLLAQEDQRQVMKDLLNVRKYSGKGWLWGGAGVAPFMQREGE